MNKIVNIILGLPKTIRFNFKVFNFCEAVKLPVILAPNVSIKWKYLHKGTINVLRSETGIVNIGFFEGIGSTISHYTVLDIREGGCLFFSGKACIAKGSYILAENADINIGENFHGGNNLKLIARKKIEIGNNVLTSWDCTVMDSDGHDILDSETSHVINNPQNISIGNNVWLGSGVNILKNTSIGNNCVIASGSMLAAKKLNDNSTVYGNKLNAVRIIRDNIKWRQ